MGRLVAVGGGAGALVVLKVHVLLVALATEAALALDVAQAGIVGVVGEGAVVTVVALAEDAQARVKAAAVSRGGGGGGATGLGDTGVTHDSSVVGGHGATGGGGGGTGGDLGLIGLDRVEELEELLKGLVGDELGGVKLGLVLLGGGVLTVVLAVLEVALNNLTVVGEAVGGDHGVLHLEVAGGGALDVGKAGLGTLVEGLELGGLVADLLVSLTHDVDLGGHLGDLGGELLGLGVVLYSLLGQGVGGVHCGSEGTGDITSTALGGVEVDAHLVTY